MISGALNLSNINNEKLGYIIKKRVKKVLIPLGCWTLIYCTIYSIFGKRNFISELIGSLLHPRSYANHLWYIYMCILVYLITPILIPIIKAGYKIVDLAIGFWIVFSLVYPLLNYFIPSIELQNYQNYNMANGCVGYYILGYRLHNKEISMPKLQYIRMIILILSWSGIIYCCYYMPEHTNLFMRFSFPLVALMSSQVYMLVKESTGLQKMFNNFKDKIQVVSKFSFGIYFIHNMIADFVKIVVKKEVMSSAMYFSLGPVMVFIISFAIVWVISKIRGLRYLLLDVKV